MKYLGLVLVACGITFAILGGSSMVVPAIALAISGALVVWIASD